VTASGCTTETPANPSNGAPYSQTDVRVGTGAEAGTTGQVTVNYTGWLYDPSKPDAKGLQFDTSIGKTPFSYVVGTNAVIQGWEQGVPGMKAGGVRRLVIPPALAYGSVRSGPIPPNTTLVFDIELISVP
jgi:FKBP-type peptidyl-prolyl cis-trans isomerase FkpA